MDGDSLLTQETEVDLRKDITGSKTKLLRSFRIVLCITGSIAAFKAPDLARELMRHGADVFVVMTRPSTRIIHPNLMEWATGNRVVTGLTGKIEHVQLAGKSTTAAHLVLIAPSTANTVSKIAAGIDDNPVTAVASVALGCKIPVVIAPGMHEPMYSNPFVLDAVRKLKETGVHFVDPVLAENKAKLAPIQKIVDEVISVLSPKSMEGLNLLVTAGPTIEQIDPVRIITNPSSGKMGMAIANEALHRGAEVTLVYGPGSEKPDYSTKVVRVKSTEEMMDAVNTTLRNRYHDVIIAAAAPADFSAQRPMKEKLSSRGRKSLTLELTPTPKIISVAKKTSPKSLLVAFKAEYSVNDKDLELRARTIIGESGADLVVANDIGRKDSGFGSETSTVLLVRAAGNVSRIRLTTKKVIASRLLDEVSKMLKRRS